MSGIRTRDRDSKRFHNLLRSGITKYIICRVYRSRTIGEFFTYVVGIVACVFEYMILEKAQTT
jgi:hypothetical protein